MDQGLAIVLAAVIAVGGVAVGLIGVVIGGRISAGAAREAAKVAADATHEATVMATGSAREDRDEARAARFADRVRELAGRLLAAADPFFSEYSKAMVDAHVDGNAAPMPQIPQRVLESRQELQLIVRTPATYKAVWQLGECLEWMAQGYGPEHAVLGSPKYEEAWQWFRKQDRDYWAARQTFEDAIRAELGRDSIERPRHTPPGVSATSPTPESGHTP
jgi:hypothetical protein